MFVIGYIPRVRHRQLPQCFPIPQTERNPTRVSSFHAPFPLCMPRDTTVAAGSSFPRDKNEHRRSNRQAATVHPVPDFFSWRPLQQCQPDVHSQLHRRYPKSQQPTLFQQWSKASNSSLCCSFASPSQTHVNIPGDTYFARLPALDVGESKDDTWCSSSCCPLSGGDSQLITEWRAAFSREPLCLQNRRNPLGDSTQPQPTYTIYTSDLCQSKENQAEKNPTLELELWLIQQNTTSVRTVTFQESQFYLKILCL